MPKYLIEASYTLEGLKGIMKTGGTARRAAVQQAVESVGGKFEAQYFALGDYDAFAIVDLPDASRIPALAEPWFLTFQANVEFHPVMTPDDLARAGLDALGKKWA